MDFTAIIEAAAALFNFITELVKAANSPDAIKAAQAQARLKQLSQLTTAQQNDDLQTEREFLERRLAELNAPAPNAGS